MAGSSPREREVGSLWCSAYPRLVGVASPRLLPPPCNPSLNPFTRHASLSSFLPSFFLSLSAPVLFLLLLFLAPARVLFLRGSPRTFPSSTFLHLQHTPRDVLTLYARLPEIVTAIRLIRNREILLSLNYAQRDESTYSFTGECSIIPARGEIVDGSVDSQR